ncbi:helix-turn-helix transcriptional regulator [Rhizobium lentis]|uniref:helix-turn-helix transcriptional regulator n=1 Tax=Rhizobium lentis TaxID=1138194 RepID=UPI001C82B7D5|nr:helix-turn-helix transcriptional regulator [Rhizobium lentis]
MIGPMDQKTDVFEARRREFAAFLRSRRERLAPSDVGLPEGIRRRTPGLRREELAMLAGVGTTWYTWLEQARNVRPSPQVLNALADALRLDDAERRHLFTLNNRQAVQAMSTTPEHVDEPLQRVLANLTHQPAYVLGRRWDVLAWNRATDVLFGGYDTLERDERNIMHRLFVDPAHRRLLVDWESVARVSLAMFRADSARYAGDPDFERLIALLMQASDEFRSWWQRHEVISPLSGIKRIDHPVMGRMSFEHTGLALTNRPEMKLIVYTPLDDDDTNSKLAKLLDLDPA